MLLQSASPAYTYKYPIDINMSILSHGNEYEAILLASGMGPQIFPISLTHHQIEELNMTLRQAIEGVRRSSRDDGASDEVLLQLANAGKSAFKTLFKHGMPILSKVLELTHTEEPTTIEIASKDFFLPWELLYDGPLDEVDVSCFWGMQYIVSRTIIQNQRPGALVSPLIQSPCPKVGLITCSEDVLEYVTRKEVPMLQRLGQQGQILLLPLRPLDTNQRHKELAHLVHFLGGEELQIVHLACHAFEQRPSIHSYLDVANHFRISREDFRAREVTVRHNPLVILNACFTGIVDSLCISGWAAESWESGARGVVATEFQVSDWFAAAFAEKLYEHLLSGEPLGESLWATRLHFWKEQKNPLGLAHALYAPLALRIIRLEKKYGYR
jgi:hypothetical protein